MIEYQAVILILLLGIAGLVWHNHRAYRRPARPELDAPREGEAPLVSVLVPARNEAGNIEGCLRGLLTQDYPNYELVVLDDGSTDDTAGCVRRLQEEWRAGGAGPRDFRLETGVGLPVGWAGKAHACWELSRHARGEWLLFLDADTRHAADLLSGAWSAARDTGADFLSTFPRQETGSAGEALTVPFIYWVLFTLLPLHLAQRRPWPALTAACGQFLFIRESAYQETGGHSAIRASLHDGLHLARLFKSAGKRVRLADLSASISCRMYRGWGECWGGFTRNAYQALGAFPALVTVTLLETVLFLCPYLFLGLGAAQGWPGWAWLCLVQVLLLVGIQVSLRRRFGYPWLTVTLHPAGIAALVAIQWVSWWRAVTHAPTAWKGRTVRTAA